MRARERESVTRASEQERESKMDRVERRRGEGGREGGRKRQREREREGGGRKGWGGGGAIPAQLEAVIRGRRLHFSAV